MEIDYEKMLELDDGLKTAVDFIEENEAETRFKYRCVIHFDDAADPVWQFDLQGKARDGQYPNVINVTEYDIYQVWCLGDIEPGLTTREPVERPLESFEYMLVTHVKDGNVTVDVVQG